jgi:ATP-dependent DNA helicase RecG
MDLNAILNKQNKIDQLNTAGIFTAEDLIRYIPRKYYDFRKPKYAKYMEDGEICAVVGTVYEIGRS